VNRRDHDCLTMEINSDVPHGNAPYS
jgi:hypothetical protein